MKVSGYRDRTITDYCYYMEKLRNFADIKYLEDITADTIYNWLDSIVFRYKVNQQCYFKTAK